MDRAIECYKGPGVLERARNGWRGPGRVGESQGVLECVVDGQGESQCVGEVHDVLEWAMEY